MFIRAVYKKDRKKQTTYTYYRLTQSYRVGNKTRQTVVLNLGKLEDLDKIFHKPLANRIEELVCGVVSTLFSELPPEVEALAQEFSLQISREKVFQSPKGKVISKALENNFQHVDLRRKEKGINDSWTTLVKRMKSMQWSIVSVNNDKQEKIYIKLFTRPSVYQKQIFDALNFKQRPFTKKQK